MRRSEQGRGKAAAAARKTPQALRRSEGADEAELDALLGRAEDEVPEEAPEDDFRAAPRPAPGSPLPRAGPGAQRSPLPQSLPPMSRWSHRSIFLDASLLES